MDKTSWNNQFERLLEDLDWWSGRASYAGLLEDFESNLDAWLEDHVYLVDKHRAAQLNLAIEGRVAIDPTASFEPGVVIRGPAYIGPFCEIGPNCLITEGVYVGPECFIGQGAEVKSSILLGGLKMYHVGYIGHSIVGRDANIGAGTIVAVRNLDGAPSTFRFPHGDYSPGLKAGALIGDGVQIGVGSIVCPGRQIAPFSTVHPQTLVIRNVPTESGSGRDKDQSQSAQVWSKVADLWNAEADRFWGRNNILLVVNGGLLALLASLSTRPLVGLITAIIGTLLCMLWYRMNLIGKYYLDRWKPVLHALEAEWLVRPIQRIDEASDTDELPNKLQPSTGYMLRLIVLIAVLWFGMVLFSSYQLWSEQQRLKAPLVTGQVAPSQPDCLINLEGKR